MSTPEIEHGKAAIAKALADMDTAIASLEAAGRALGLPPRHGSTVTTFRGIPWMRIPLKTRLKILDSWHPGWGAIPRT